MTSPDVVPAHTRAKFLLNAGSAAAAVSFSGELWRLVS